MNVKSLILLGVSALALHTSARGSIIDDKSQFVGDFTVIDFETRGDGSPLILREGGWIELLPDEYAPFGLTISASLNFLGNERAFVGNGLENPQSDAAHAASGSPPNVLVVSGPNGYVRFDFEAPVNAVALNIQNWTDGDPVDLAVYDVYGSLIDSLRFDHRVIDGVVLGEDFGNHFDIEYGFAGLFTPETMISYAIISEDRTTFDDVHFGIIPEPGTLGLVCVAFGLATLRRCRRTSSIRVASTPVCIVCIGILASAAIADDYVTGQVKGWVDLTDGPICGDNAWAGCVNPELQLITLNGVRVCVEGFPTCDFASERCAGDSATTCTEDTDCPVGQGPCAEGRFRIPYEGPAPITAG